MINQCDRGLNNRRYASVIINVLESAGSALNPEFALGFWGIRKVKVYHEDRSEKAGFQQGGNKYFR